jgi:hypothetical protein
MTIPVELGVPRPTFAAGFRQTRMRMPSPADLLQEARTSLRVLLRAPMLTAAIVLTVGVGVGATTAIFAAVDAALLRPLPYAAPDRLVWIYTDTPPFRFRLSAVDYLALEAQQTQFESVSAYTERSMAFTSGSTDVSSRRRTSRCWASRRRSAATSPRRTASRAALRR